MEKILLVPSFSSPTISDTVSLNAPSASVSPSIDSLANPNPSSTSVEQQKDGPHNLGADSQGPPQEGRFSISSNSDEERQHICDILPDSGHDGVTHERFAWNASLIWHGAALEQGSPGGDANRRYGSDDVKASQRGKDMGADVEKGLVFADAKRVDGEEEGQGDCCRVCHLSLVKSPHSGEIIRLGCACKDDLAVAHRLCAETWFKIRGNRTCEICGSTAQNIVGSGDGNSTDPGNDGEANNPGPRRSERCWQNQPICNTVLVCVILVLIASWLFRVTLF